MPSWMGCQMKNMRMPTRAKTRVLMMGTNRVPPKKESTWGIWTL